MSEMKLQFILGIAGVLAFIVPVALLIRELWKETFPRSVLIIDQAGNVLGEISAESVQKVRASDMAELHERASGGVDMSRPEPPPRWLRFVRL